MINIGDEILVKTLTPKELKEANLKDNISNLYGYVYEIVDNNTIGINVGNDSYAVPYRYVTPTSNAWKEFDIVQKEKIQRTIKMHTNTVIHYLQQLERLGVPNAKETLDFFLNDGATMTELEKHVKQIKDNEQWHRNLMIQQFNKDPEPKTFWQELVDVFSIW